MTKEKTPFSFKKRLNSFRHAINGLRILLQSEHNTWIHLAATIIVLAAGIIFNISIDSWFMLTVAIALVWMAEAVNTAIEFIVDLISPAIHPLAKKAKDVAAAAVLLASITAIIIALLVVIKEMK
jgi:diacylglycerol kinase